MSGKFKVKILGKKVCKDCPSLELKKDLDRCMELLDLLTPDPPELEKRPGLRKTFVAADKFLQERGVR